MPKKIEVPNGMAHCGKCKLVLPKDRFHITVKNKNGCDGYCKECRLSYHRRKYDQEPNVIPPPGHKYCPHCEKIKPDGFFHEGLLKQKQLRSMYCKECKSNIVYREPRRTDKRSGGRKFGINHHSFKAASTIVSADPLRLSYAAGVFDSEGSAQIMPSIQGTPVLAIHGDSSILMSEINEILGGKLRFYERVKKFKDGTIAKISSGKVFISRLSEVHAAGVALVPYLSLKRARTELVVHATQISPDERVSIRPLVDGMNKKCIREEIRIPKPVDKSDCVNEIPDIEYAYLAGVIDGDGWIGYFDRILSIRIAVTKFEFIMRIYNVFGGKIEEIETPPHHATAACLTISFKALAWEVVLRRLINHMVLKRRHAELALGSIFEAPAVQYKAKQEMQRLTQFSRLEKFERVKNQLAEFSKRIVRGKDGKICEILSLPEVMDACVVEPPEEV